MSVGGNRGGGSIKMNKKQKEVNYWLAAVRKIDCYWVSCTDKLLQFFIV